jgi:hypothetical protein
MPLTFEMSFASHRRATLWSDRNIIKPEDVPLYHQASKYWFKCDVCPHEFETFPYKIAERNSWCSYCSNKKLCDDVKCSICFEKSFASSDKAECWSNKNTVNPRTVFKFSQKKFIFNCNTCSKEFTAHLSNISRGSWCRSCGVVNSKKKRSMKLKEFLERSAEVHGDTYDYSKVILNGVDRNVIIICKIHGEFPQTPFSHYSDKSGCPHCAIIRRADKNRYTLDEFIGKANKVHSDKYDYSKVIYINSEESVIIICKIHGEFIQEPNSHLQGFGCKKCGIISRSDKQRQTPQEFIIKAREIHGDRYDYSKINYISTHINITIICRIHGDFTQDPSNHLHGHGCPHCAKTKIGDSNRYTLDEFISKANEVHANKYDYSKVIYINCLESVIIICKKCGVFNQSPTVHLRGAGCSTCLNKTESKLYKWLKSIYPNVVKEYKADWCINPLSGRCLRYDFMIPDIMTIIELDGRQHFMQVRNWDNPLYTIKRDIFKMQKAKAKGYKIIRILQEDVYKNNNEWLNENLLSEINNSDRTDICISSIDTIYDEHIKLIESGVIIVLDGSDSSEEDTNSEI